MTVLNLEGITGNTMRAIKAVMAERKFQDEKYGPVVELDDKLDRKGPGKGGHDLAAWLIVIEKELAEAKDAATGNGRREKTGRNTTRAELVQIAAVCLAALEQHGTEEPGALVITGKDGVDRPIRTYKDGMPE